MPVDYRFGPFRLDAKLRILLRGSQPTGIGQRAAALLRLLLERAGEPVAKEDLIAAAWPGLAVEDSNLTVQMAALRKALGEAGGAAWIETLARRGYRYVGPPVAAHNSEAGPGDLAPTPPLPINPSLAVLPFANLGDDPEQAYFTDGMVDDIITGLARIKWLFVIGRGTTLAYKGRTVQPKEAGRELGVRYLLEGSVRRAGDRVRINCQLVEAASGAQVWAERYDRRLDDVFALQDEIAAAVVAALEPGLRRAEIERIRRKRPDSLDAYELVLKAQPDVDTGMPQQVVRALEHLERSLALTYAGFSIGMDGHDRAAASTAFEAALAVSASSALTYILGSVVFGWGGEAERAIAWSERGMRLSPFDPWAFAAYDARALGYFHLDRYEEAAAAAYKSNQANPAHSITYVQMAAALAKLGRLDEARKAAARVLQLHPAFRYSRQFAGVGCAPALAAKMAEALSATGLPE